MACWPLQQTMNVEPDGMDDNTLSTCSIQESISINETDITLTNQISPKDLSDNMNDGEHSMNTGLDMSEIKPEEDSELDFFCKESLCVYGSGYGTAVDTEDVFYICKTKCKYLYHPSPTSGGQIQDFQGGVVKHINDAGKNCDGKNAGVSPWICHSTPNFTDPLSQY